MILVVGLSPAWQRTLWFDRIRSGEVNRTARVRETAAGKGVNVARIACTLGGRSHLLTVAGGGRGHWLTRALHRDRLPVTVVRVEGETRVCQTLITRDGITELVEETRALRAHEVKRVRREFEQRLRRATMIVFMGSVPKGCGDRFYETLGRAASKRGLPVIVDAQGPQLMNCLRVRPYLVRINRHELAAATGRDCRATRHTLLAARELLRLGARHAVISDGEHGVIAVGPNTHWRFQPPRVKTVNPVGSGDAMLAGMVMALSRGKTLPEAVRLGIACGAANALTETSGVVRRADAMKLLPRVRGPL